MVKAFEAEQYLNLGVAEIVMAVNYSFIKSRQWPRLEDDIAAVTRLTQPANVVLKVILETAMLSLDEISRATTIAAFVHERSYGNVGELVEITKAKLGEYAPVIGATFLYQDDRYRYEG